MNENTHKTVRILKVIRENTKVKSFILDGQINALPGQYVMVWIPGKNEKPFGVASVKPFMLTIARTGPCTEIMHTLKKGDRLSYRGPYGQPFNAKSVSPMLVGGGYGIVPLYFLACTLPPSVRKKTTVLLAAKTKSELLFEGRFEKLGCRIETATDDGSKGFKGYAPDLAGQVIAKRKIDGVYTCGPSIMMKKVALLCREKSIPVQASLEAYFKCGGFGICGQCAVKGKLVCTEGPVFEGDILLD